MIGIILIIATILFFCAWNLCHHHTKIYALLATIFLIVIVCGVILNYHNHLGMHIRNVKSTYKIKPTSKQGNILIYEPLGSQKKHQIYLYRKHNKMEHTKLDINNQNKLYKTNHKYGYITLQKKQWKDTSFGKLCFGLMQPKGNTENTITKLYIPKTWHVLSVQQSKVMKKDAEMQGKLDKQQLKSPQAQMMLKQKMQGIVQQKLQVTAMKNPQILQNPIVKNKVIKQITKQLKQQYMNKAKEQIMKEALQRAEQAPVGYKA